MPLYGASVTKEVEYRGSTQPFSNVYYYDGTTFPVGEATVLLAELVRIERELHGQNVNFLEGRVWSAGGTPAENEMLLVQDLDGTGSTGTSAYLDPERAVLMQVEAGTNVRGRPVYLRKWFHVAGTPPGNPGDWPQLVLRQQDPISEAYRGLYADIFAQLRDIVLAGYGNYQLRGPTGREPTGPATCYRWLEHHQMGDAWRR